MNYLRYLQSVAYHFYNLRAVMETAVDHLQYHHLLLDTLRRYIEHLSVNCMYRMRMLNLDLRIRLPMKIEHPDYVQFWLSVCVAAFDRNSLDYLMEIDLINGAASMMMLMAAAAAVAVAVMTAPLPCLDNLDSMRLDTVFVSNSMLKSSPDLSPHRLDDDDTNLY